MSCRVSSWLKARSIHICDNRYDKTRYAAYSSSLKALIYCTTATVGSAGNCSQLLCNILGGCFLLQALDLPFLSISLLSIFYLILLCLNSLPLCFLFFGEGSTKILLFIPLCNVSLFVADGILFCASRSFPFSCRIVT